MGARASTAVEIKDTKFDLEGVFGVIAAHPWIALAIVVTLYVFHVSRPGGLLSDILKTITASRDREARVAAETPALIEKYNQLALPFNAPAPTLPPSVPGRTGARSSRKTRTTGGRR